MRQRQSGMATGRVNIYLEAKGFRPAPHRLLARDHQASAALCRLQLLAAGVQASSPSACTERAFVSV